MRIACASSRRTASNLRVNVDDGKATVDGALKFKEGDAQAGKTPKVIAGAYTNSANPKPAATALYDIDEAGHLLSQAPPNDGVLNTIGMLGVKIDGPAAFNIVNKGEENAAWLVTGGMLYSVDLKTGKAAEAGQIEGVTGKLTRHRLDRLRCDRAVRRCPPARLDGSLTGGPLRPTQRAVVFQRMTCNARVRPSPS